VTATLAGVSRLQLAPVAEGLTDFEAKVVTARLGADGILWEVRGIVDSLYPLGRIDVLVPLDELEAAQLSLSEDAAARAEALAAIDFGPEAVEPDGRRLPPGPRKRWVTAAVVLGLAAFSATRIVAAVTAFQEERPEDCSGPVQSSVEGMGVGCRR
jgi:hypothetical protein